VLNQILTKQFLRYETQFLKMKDLDDAPPQAIPLCGMRISSYEKLAGKGNIADDVQIGGEKAC
jgi:hypothetical protein